MIIFGLGILVGSVGTLAITAALIAGAVLVDRSRDIRGHVLGLD